MRYCNGSGICGPGSMCHTPVPRGIAGKILDPRHRLIAESVRASDGCDAMPRFLSLSDVCVSDAAPYLLKLRFAVRFKYR